MPKAWIRLGTFEESPLAVGDGQPFLWISSAQAFRAISQCVGVSCVSWLAFALGTEWRGFNTLNDWYGYTFGCVLSHSGSAPPSKGKPRSPSFACGGMRFSERRNQSVRVIYGWVFVFMQKYPNFAGNKTWWCSISYGVRNVQKKVLTFCLQSLYE